MRVNFLGTRPQPKRALSGVVGLIEGFEVVVWIGVAGRRFTGSFAEESAETLEEVIARTYAWNERKTRVFPTPDRARD